MLEYLKSKNGDVKVVAVELRHQRLSQRVASLQDQRISAVPETLNTHIYDRDNSVTNKGMLFETSRLIGGT